MSIIQMIILGLVQGLTEFIPVSSSGHLIIAQYLLNITPDHMFLEFINAGTFLALGIYFRQKIIDIFVDIFKHHKYNLARNIIITAVPAGAIGFLLSDYIDSHSFFSNGAVVVITLAVVGAIMVGLERIPRASAVKDGEHLSPLRALLVGLAQVFALIPGVSRSGSTIIAGRLAGLKDDQAAEYSFLASLPIMFGVTLKTFLGDKGYLVSHLSIVLVSNLFAFIFGMLAIGFLMKYLSHHDLKVFGWYRVVVAVVFLGFLLLQ